MFPGFSCASSDYEASSSRCSSASPAGDSGSMSGYYQHLSPEGSYCSLGSPGTPQDYCTDLAVSSANFVPTVTAISTSQDLQWLVQPTLISSIAPSRAHPYGPATAYPRTGILKTSGGRGQSLGRRSKMEQLSPEEEEKRRVRRERNKMAAAKCRNRRRELTDTLQSETDDLEDEKSSLQNEIASLLKEKEKLEFILAAHKPACKIPGDLEGAFQEITASMDLDLIPNASSSCSDIPSASISQDSMDAASISQASQTYASISQASQSYASISQASQTYSSISQASLVVPSISQASLAVAPVSQASLVSAPMSQASLACPPEESLFSLSLISAHSCHPDDSHLEKKSSELKAEPFDDFLFPARPGALETARSVPDVDLSSSLYTSDWEPLYNSVSVDMEPLSTPVVTCTPTCTTYTSSFVFTYPESETFPNCSSTHRTANSSNATEQSSDSLSSPTLLAL